MNGNKKRLNQTIFAVLVGIAVISSFAYGSPINCLRTNGNYCEKCNVGFSLSTTRPDGFFDLCLSNCQKGFKSEVIDYILTTSAFSAATCVPCEVQYCENCDPNKAFCKRCKYNSWLYDSDGDGNYEACVDCPTGNAVDPSNIDGTGVCLTCTSNCKVCNPKDVCVQCNLGYYLFNVNNDGKFICTKCNGDKQFRASSQPNDGTGICIYCTIPDCKICQMDISLCQECVSGKYLFDSNKDNKYETCSADCILDGYFISTLENVVGYCKPCLVPKCSVCNMEGANCVKCNSGYHRVDTLNIAFSPPEDGIYDTCSNAAVAPAGYFKEPSTDGTGRHLRCDMFISYCATCTQKTSCNACMSDFYLFSTNNDVVKDKCIQCTGNKMYYIDSGECKLCSRLLTKCLKCTDANTCVQCDENYFLTKDNKCVASCPVGTFVSVSDENLFARCVDCNTITPNCAACIYGGSCTKCDSNKFLTSTKDNGIYDTCGDCTGNNVKPNDASGSGVCKQIDKQIIGCTDVINLSGTLTCNVCLPPYILQVSSKNCVLFCAEGEYLDIINNKCIANTIPDCEIVKSKNNLCDKCIAGKVLATQSLSLSDNDFTTCVDCKSPTLYNENGLTDGRGICRLCNTESNNCIECKNSLNVCTKCKPGFFLYTSGDNVSCVNCGLDSQYRVNDKCFDCSSAIAGCNKCQNPNKQCVDCLPNLQCSECSQGLFLRSSKNNTDFDSCIKCKEITQVVVGTQCKNCDQLISNCQQCFGNPSTCYKCSQNNYLYSSNSSRNNDVCSPCTDPKQLVLTTANKDGDGLCINCDNLIPGCEVCKDRICKKCKKGLFLFDNGGFSCSPCVGDRFSQAVRDGVDVCSLIPAPIQPNITLLMGESSLTFVFKCPAGKGNVLYMIGTKNNVVAANLTTINSQLTGNSDQSLKSINGPLGNSSVFGKLPYSTIDDTGVALNIKAIDFAMNFHVGYYCLNDIDVASEKQVQLIGKFTNPYPERSMKEKEMEVWIPVGVSIFIVFLFAAIYSIYVLVKKY